MLDFVLNSLQTSSSRQRRHSRACSRWMPTAPSFTCALYTSARLVSSTSIRVTHLTDSESLISIFIAGYPHSGCRACTQDRIGQPLAIGGVERGGVQLAIPATSRVVGGGGVGRRQGFGSPGCTDEGSRGCLVPGVR
jgi:hypothetical protein